MAEAHVYSNCRAHAHMTHPHICIFIMVIRVALNTLHLPSSVHTDCCSAENLAPNYHVSQQKTTMLQHEKTTNRQNIVRRRCRQENKAEHNNLHVRDMVLMRNDKWSNKLSSAFSHKPIVVIDIRVTAVTAADDKHTVRRNTYRFKKVLDPVPCFKLKKLVVEKSMSLLGQSCRQHRL